jgi:carbamoyl-phosphate synthase large subunit
VAILNNDKEVELYIQQMPEGIVFQEYVGSPSEEYTVGVLVSREGEIVDSIVLHRNLIGLSLGTHRKIDEQYYALSTGYSQGFVVRRPDIQSACESLALQMGIRGPVNMQLRMADGKPVFFEVHPRFSGTTSIRADVGFNEPDILIRNFVLGERFGRLSYRTDVAAIRAFKAIIVPMEDMKNILSA